MSVSSGHTKRAYLRGAPQRHPSSRRRQSHPTPEVDIMKGRLFVAEAALAILFISFIFNILPNSLATEA